MTTTETGNPGGRKHEKRPELERTLGAPEAVLLGLGAILGTGVFVSIGIAAQTAGPAVIAAVAMAAVVAACNGLSSAQLAASHPVSGGSYEYGYRYLNPMLGFIAGWMFLCAKSASAATAALGLSGYVLAALGRPEAAWQVTVAAAAVAVMTLVVAGGMRRSSRANTAIVLLTVAALVAFVAAGVPVAVRAGSAHLEPFFAHGTRGLFEATALMFVAYTGYGRIATLGEEVRDPATTIPRAVVITMVVVMVLYVAVAAVAVAAAGAPSLAAATRVSAAPLEVIARGLGVPGLAWLVLAGAVTAMLGVLLNLILGLSRVALAMARRGDLPAGLATIDARGATPRIAVMAVGAGIAGLVLVGDVKTTWSFSAFTVLVYYAITNLAALRLPAGARRYPRWIPALGLISCLSLAFWVEPRIWLLGLGLIALGLVWHRVAGAGRSRV